MPNKLGTRSVDLERRKKQVIFHSYLTLESLLLQLSKVQAVWTQNGTVLGREQLRLEFTRLSLIKQILQRTFSVKSHCLAVFTDEEGADGCGHQTGLSICPHKVRELHEATGGQL